MVCFVIYGANLYVSKYKFKSFEQMYYILIILVDFLLLKFSMILADVVLPGSGSD